MFILSDEYAVETLHLMTHFLLDPDDTLPIVAIVTEIVEHPLSHVWNFIKIHFDLLGVVSTNEQDGGD